MDQNVPFTAETLFCWRLGRQTFCRSVCPSVTNQRFFLSFLYLNAPQPELKREMMIVLTTQSQSVSNVSVRRASILLLVHWICPLAAGPSESDWTRNMQLLCCLRNVWVRSGSRSAVREFRPVEGIRAGSSTEIWVAPPVHQKGSLLFFILHIIFGLWTVGINNCPKII